MRRILTIAAMGLLGLGCAAAGGSNGGKAADAAGADDASVGQPTDTVTLPTGDLGPAPIPDEGPAPPSDPGPAPTPDPGPPPTPDPGPPPQTGEWGAELCPDAPAGVAKGYDTGQQLADIKLKDCDGNDVWLSDFCGASALWIFGAHGW